MVNCTSTSSGPQLPTSLPKPALTLGAAETIDTAELMHWTVTVPPTTNFELLDAWLDDTVVGAEGDTAVVVGEPPGDDFELVPGSGLVVVGDDPG